MRTAALFVAMFGFWLALSGRFDPVFLAMGVVSAAVVTWMTKEMMHAALGEPLEQVWRLPYRTWRALVYAAWMLGRMAIGSAQVTSFVFHPRMPIDPRLLRFRTDLRNPLARVAFANSITLVPGTMTVRLDETGELLVHALVPHAADDLLTGRMQTMIAKIFLEGVQPPPTVTWEPAPREPEGLA